MSRVFHVDTSLTVTPSTDDGARHGVGSRSLHLLLKALLLSGGFQNPLTKNERKVQTFAAPSSSFLSSASNGWMAWKAVGSSCSGLLEGSGGRALAVP